MKQVLNRIRIALNLATMTDAELLQLVVAIVALAPTSSLIGVAAVAGSVAAVTAKGTAFKSADDDVTADEERLRNDRTTKLAARGTLENEITALAGIVGTNAKTATDVTGMAFNLRESPTVSNSGPEVPDQIDVVMPKKVRGRCKASVHETGKTHGRYVAQSSPDPIGTWSDLPGTGKSRTITGQSGTKVWVRFARVRAQLQSGWSNPVLVTIP